MQTKLFLRIIHPEKSLFFRYLVYLNLIWIINSDPIDLFIMFISKDFIFTSSPLPTAQANNSHWKCI